MRRDRRMLKDMNGDTVMSERRLNGMAALIAAQNTQLKVGVDEKHTAFVKRIVNAYLDAVEALEAELKK